MDYKRTLLYTGLFAVSYILWMTWVKDHSHQQQPGTTVTTEHPVVAEQQSSSSASYIPNVVDKHENTTTTQQVSSTVDKSRWISVKTDVMNVAIDLVQGNVVDTTLSKYDQSAKEPNKPFKLLYSGDDTYVANNSLFVRNDKGVENIEMHFKATSASYQLAPHEQELVVTLTGQHNGLQVKKNFHFKRGSYLVSVDYALSNQSEKPWKGYMNTQLVRNQPENQGSSIFHVASYTGASYSVPGTKLYKKLSFKDMLKGNLSQNVKDGWVAMQQHYFLTAWVPPVNSDNHFYSRVVDGEYIIGYVSKPIHLAAGEKKTIGNRLFLGPELTAPLSKIAPGLDLTVDYGWLWFISKYLFLLMSFIHSVVGNWGWSIVLVTICVKALFFQLSAKSYRSMAGMKKLQPKIEALRTRYADDKAKLSQATMELYRSEKVNPFGGCLPIIVQIPVFIALYWVLLESVELRQAPWILWIHDLSEADPYYILPIIMGLTMLLQQKLAPASPDPDQAKMMMMLPVVFTFLFSHFPAGLVLYWTVNNSLSILQQWYITKKYSGEKKNTNLKLKKALG